MDIELTGEQKRIFDKRMSESSRTFDHVYLLSLGYDLTSDFWDVSSDFWICYYSKPDNNGVSRCIRYHKPTGVYTKAYKSVNSWLDVVRWRDCIVSGTAEYKLFKRSYIIKNILNKQ